MSEADKPGGQGADDLRGRARAVLLAIAESARAPRHAMAKVAAAKAILDDLPEDKAIPAWAPPEQPAPNLDMSPEQDPSWS